LDPTWKLKVSDEFNAAWLEKNPDWKAELDKKNGCGDKEKETAKTTVQEGEKPKQTLKQEPTQDGSEPEKEGVNHIDQKLAERLEREFEELPEEEEDGDEEEEEEEEEEETHIISKQLPEKDKDIQATEQDHLQRMKELAQVQNLCPADMKLADFVDFLSVPVKQEVKHKQEVKESMDKLLVAITQLDEVATQVCRQMEQCPGLEKMIPITAAWLTGTLDLVQRIKTEILSRPRDY
jgi:hypothetical protein